MKRDDVHHGVKASADRAVLVLSLAIAVSLCPGCSRSSGRSDRSSIDRAVQSGHRIDAAVKTIELVLAAAPAELATSSLAGPPAARAHPAEEAAPTVDFELQGIIGTERAPMILTSVGVVGLGEEVHGFKVVSIQDDSVTVADRRGRQVKIRLYKEESKP